MHFAVPEGRNLPDSSLPELRIPRRIQGQIHREPGAWRLNARERRSSLASLLAHEGLLFFWGCERAAEAAPVALGVANPGTSAGAPGAVSPWPRGFSQPLLQDAPATGSSSVQWPCHGLPGPGAERVGWGWDWSQKWLVRPCTGDHGGSLLQMSSCLSQARDAQCGDDSSTRLRQDGAGPSRRQFLRPAANPPGHSRCALCGVSGLAPPRAGGSHGAQGWRALLLRHHSALVAWGCGSSGRSDARMHQQLKPGHSNQDCATKQSHGWEG